MSIKITAADIGEQFVTRVGEVVKLYAFYPDHSYPCKFETADGEGFTTQTDGYTHEGVTEWHSDVLERFVVQPAAGTVELDMEAPALAGATPVSQLVNGETCLVYPELEEDEVNHPSHYKQGAIECIEAIRAALTPEEFRGYCKGNLIKYVWREKYKQQDVAIEKAVWYANTMLGKAND